ncbi:MAG: ParA family protein [Gammaproteobacteria bacterium]|nr:ParA family protein [Gammaproteobacteria bacterium]
MHNIAVLNAKGGSGKTTIATTLACYFSGKGYSTALMDFDPQQSSSHWLNSRSEDLPNIRSIDAAKRGAGVTRSWQLYSGQGTEVVIIDTPAGTSGGQLSDLYNRADTILIPVMPSIIDIHAVELFLKDLGRLMRHRGDARRIVIIANRVRIKTKSYQAIKRLAEEAGITLITSLRDTQYYPIAMESGRGICELKNGSTKRDAEQWAPLLDWLHQDIPRKEAAVSEQVVEKVSGSATKIKSLRPLAPTLLQAEC